MKGSSISQRHRKEAPQFIVPLGNVAVNQRAWEEDEDLTKYNVS